MRSQLEAELNQPAIYGGEQVEIIGYQSSPKRFQIEFKSGRKEYIKANQLTP
ncbi:MAG: hypothetical protein RMY34_22165 [Aulosira sp. DedQUE10]|nr:hypothetical protein [Aulosira sp. DedQUE10]